MDVYILNQNLDTVYVVDAYTSLIWDMYYNQLGRGELYIPASAEALRYITVDSYVVRSDSDRVCRIRTRQLTTDAENGDYIIATLEAVEGILAQRIIWATETCNGKLEPFIHRAVDDQLGSGATSARQIRTDHGLMIQTGTLSGLTAVSSEQTTYTNLLEKIIEWCKREGWGVKLTYQGTYLRFVLYQGTDRSNLVYFSDEYGNLISTQYTDDRSRLGNVAVIAGEGQGAERLKITTGTSEGIARHEKYVDARDLSREIPYSDLIKSYPGGTIQATAEQDVYIYVADVDIPVMSSEQLAKLQESYPDGYVIEIDSKEFFRVERATIAALGTDTPGDSETCVLSSGLYYGYLTDRGITALGEYGARTSFSGEIEPNMNFEFGRDYFLGDIVTIQNEYGITVKARIIEVLEVFDENGYQVTPNFELIGE